MTATSTEMTSSDRRLLGEPLRARGAFVLLTSILVTLLASSSAPTPLYATYQARRGFSPVTITVIFGVYAVAVLASLLMVGSLSGPRASRRSSRASSVAHSTVTQTAEEFDLTVIALAAITSVGTILRVRHAVPQSCLSPNRAA